MCVGWVLGWDEGSGQVHSSHLEEHVQRACGRESIPVWLGYGEEREGCEAGIMQALSGSQLRSWPAAQA